MNRDGIPCEDFIAFLEVERITGAAVAESVLQFLEDIGLPATGQGYDGASNMAGKHQGCAAIIRNQFPPARYVHCAAHALNLCVLAACNVDEVSKMWATIKELFFLCFFDNSPQRSGHLRATIEDTQPEGERRRHLISLCKTRWVARLDALDTFVDLFDSVVATLKSIEGTDGNRDWSPSNRAPASSLLVAITSFQFLLAVTVHSEFFSPNFV